ncbi:MAG TPA: GntG family PLP-dependent aldolase [Pirellula sp.]|nr:GntG family PLP-dependent aldolase [Pirellula sp.]
MTEALSYASHQFKDYSKLLIGPPTARNARFPSGDRVLGKLKIHDTMQIIDLRSDTVTKPTPGMREAMRNAPVGDDVIDIDPTAVELQEHIARLLGKEAAIFMPSGTMTNQIALRVHCTPGDEFICEAGCHIYNFEQGAFAQLSGLVAKTIPGQNGLLDLEQLVGTVRPENEHMVRTRLLCIENTHNRGAGKIYSLARVQSLCEWAHSQGLKTHLDGARLFNASVATGVSLHAYSEPFESVSVCFSKGLGAPVGSCLAGSREFIAKARRARKLFGGGMRQIGVLAAGALYALKHQMERLVDDHEHAKLLARAVSQCTSLRLSDEVPDSNIVIFHVAKEFGTAVQFSALLKQQGILSLPFGPQSIRLVTHLDVCRKQIARACEAIASVSLVPSS